MNFLKKSCKIAAVAAITMMAGAALAQYDTFGGPRTLVVFPPQSFAMSGTTAVAKSNVVDISRFEGVAIAQITVVSNSSDPASVPAMTIVPLTSDTGTNAWRPLTNYALALSNTLFNTNYWGTSNASFTISTNQWLAPGTITNQAVSAGFAGQYIVPSPFTNSGSFATTAGAGSVFMIGFNPNDQGKYLMFQLILTGTNSVYGAGGTMTSRTKQGIFY